MEFEIKNRFTGAVQITADITCDYSESYDRQLGLAVMWVVKNLGGVNLGGANLRGADLRDACLKGAYLRGAYLGDSDLRGANLRGADLIGADLTGADLMGANLRGADLIGTNLAGAYLRSANLIGANLIGANLGNADLGGLILLARATRSDGYEYFAWTSVLGGMIIMAGSHIWIGNDAIQQARIHCETVTSIKHRKEALSIIAHIERMM